MASVVCNVIISDRLLLMYNVDLLKQKNMYKIDLNFNKNVLAKKKNKKFIF